MNLPSAEIREDTYRIPPNIIIEFRGSDDAGGDGADIEPEFAYEIEIQQILIKKRQRILQRQGEFHQLQKYPTIPIAADMDAIPPDRDDHKDGALADDVPG